MSLSMGKHHTLQCHRAMWCCVATLHVLMLYPDACGRAVIVETDAISVDRCGLFCNQSLLHTLQLAYNRGGVDDDKALVDRPLLDEPLTILNAFNALNDTSPSTLRIFVDKYFGVAGSDLIVAQLPLRDSYQFQLFLNQIHDPLLNDFAQQLTSMWDQLARKISQTVYSQPHRHSLIAPLHNFFVVPGGRFREAYYWDTYWIIEGLLRSGHEHSAMQMVENLLDLVNRFGFVPNGFRKYYLTRSQPPLLCFMVDSIYNHMIKHKPNNAISWLTLAYPILKREYKFWMKRNRHLVNVGGHWLNRYYSKVNSPRPESYAIDYMNAITLADEYSKTVFYSNVVAAAESGWDFSSRWLRDRKTITSINTMDIIPVDLNMFMLRIELCLVRYSRLLGFEMDVEIFSNAVYSRRQAVTALLWDDNRDLWRDFDMKTQSFGLAAVSSNLFGMLLDDEQLGDMPRPSNVTHRNSIYDLMQDGGAATTLIENSQQWDFPDAWAPIQHILVQGLLNRNGNDELREIALELARRWLQTNLVAYYRTSFMHEKYDCRTIGGVGGGGEYHPQTGFGWTNGVALMILEQFGNELMIDPIAWKKCQKCGFLGKSCNVLRYVQQKE